MVVSQCEGVGEVFQETEDRDGGGEGEVVICSVMVRGVRWLSVNVNSTGTHRGMWKMHFSVVHGCRGARFTCTDGVCERCENFHGLKSACLNYVYGCRIDVEPCLTFTKLFNNTTFSLNWAARPSVMYRSLCGYPRCGQHCVNRLLLGISSSDALRETHLGVVPMP